MGEKCNGYGECYLEKIECEHKCTKCPNYNVCGAICPQEYLSCSAGLCVNCDVLFGTWKGGPGNLTFIHDDCPVCLEENTICVHGLYCKHVICINCFKRMHYGKERTNYPDFPYPKNIEDEYESDPENIKWENEYPLIKEFNQEWNKYDDIYIEEWENESEYLTKCPICRK